MSDNRNDGPFEAVLQNTGNIDVFVDEFFSFLARRTDFFVVSPPEGGRIGFPPGMAAKIISSKFKKWQEFRNGPSTNTKAVTAPEPVKTVEVVTESKGGVSTDKIAETGKKQGEGSSGKESSSGSSTTTTTIVTSKGDDRNSKIGSWNGRKTDKYAWSQSIKDLDVHVFLGKEVKSKRDVEVKIHTDRISVKVPALPEPVVVDWKLSHPIIKDESYWSLHPGESVFFTMQKVKEMWWDHVFDGEETIDQSKIEAVRPMEDLDEEEQAKIHELMFNQEQKRKGLPTSDQMKMEEIMKKAWDAEGSPFKGEPFDPTRVQLATNTITQ